MEIKKGKSVYSLLLPGDYLKPGLYFLKVALLIPNVKIFDIIEEFPFSIDDTGRHATIQQDNRLGIITPKLVWSVTDE